MGSEDVSPRMRFDNYQQIRLSAKILPNQSNTIVKKNAGESKKLEV